MAVVAYGPDPSITKLLDALGLGGLEVRNLALSLKCDDAVTCYVEFMPTTDQLEHVADAVCDIRPGIVACPADVSALQFVGPSRAGGEINTGDVVWASVLDSEDQGAKMVVESIRGDLATCVWFQNKRLRRKAFPLSVLHAAQTPPQASAETAQA